MAWPPSSPISSDKYSLSRQLHASAVARFLDDPKSIQRSESGMTYYAHIGHSPLLAISTGVVLAAVRATRHYKRYRRPSSSRSTPRNSAVLCNVAVSMSLFTSPVRLELACLLLDRRASCSLLQRSSWRPDDHSLVSSRLTDCCPPGIVTLSQ